MDVKPGKFQVSTNVKIVYSSFIFLGGLAFIWGLINDPTRIWQSYLTSFFFFVSLALGGLFFAAIQHITNAGWSVNVRRIAEALPSFLPFGAAAGIAFLFGLNELYTWMDPQVIASDDIVAEKTPYLNATFMVIRMLLFFALWLFFAWRLVGNSLKQDETGDVNLTHKNLRLGVQFLLTFALSYSLFAVDTLMSLMPHWYSTMFGVYAFAGLFQSTLATIIILTIWLMKQGLVRGIVTDDHLHDMGKFLKGFTVFMAYIGFSQFMLIWYANLPEETQFYLLRSQGGWMGVSLALLIFKFVVPFLALLPKAAKRNHGHLVLISSLILVMQYIDIYWLVYPNFNDGHVVFNFYEILVFLGFAGLFLRSVTEFLSKHSLIPVKDPRLSESMAHKVTY